MNIKKPFYADFLLTPKCNLKCGFCSATSNVFKCDQNQLALPRIEKLFNEFDDLDMLRVSLEGGEPFLRKDIKEILEMAGKRDFSTYVNTNGTLIDKKMAESVAKSGIDKVCISLDGPNSNIHDKSRGVNGTFVKAQRAIKNLLEENVDVDAIYTITKINYNFLLETMGYLKSLGVKNMAVMLLASVGSANKNLNDLILSFKEWQEVLVKLTNLKKDGLLPINLSFVPAGEGKCPWELYLPLKQIGMGEDLKYWMRPGEYSTLSDNDYGCTAGKDNFAIDGEGNVFGCSLMVSQKKLCAGNINEKSLKDIWFNSNTFKIMRKNSLKNIKGVCKTCELLKTCKGGCRACAFGVTGDYNESDPRCSIVRGEYENKN